MIGPGITISGDVSADTNLKVEGRVQGRSIQGAMDVEIGESGKVVANIMAKFVKVAGEVSGDIAGSEKVMITKTGRVQGNVVAPRVQLEDGALFRGSIEMNPTPAVEKKPAATAAETKVRSSKTAPVQGTPTPSGSARKEPGLTLKSG